MGSYFLNIQRLFYSLNYPKSTLGKSISNHYLSLISFMIVLPLTFLVSSAYANSCSLNDCTPSNTLKVIGIPPNCKCLCRPGFGGAKCAINQDILKVDNPGRNYESEFWNICDAFDVLDDGIKTCQEFGNGWDIASPITQKAIDKILDGSLYTWGVWVGGKTSDLDNWYWLSGRVKGMQFYQRSSNKIYNNFDVPWYPGEPNNATCDDGIPQTAINIQHKLNGNNFYDYQDHKYCGNAPECVACERSLCNIPLDCDGSRGTANVSGYYPDCTCNCKINWNGKKCDNLVCVINDCIANNTYKYAPTLDGEGCMCVCFPGWIGDKCQTSYAIPSVTIKNRNYTSEYWSTCKYNISSYVMAVQTCRAFGNGWDMATAPSEDSAKSISALSNFIFGSSSNRGTFVGGEVYDNFNTWKWNYGRIKNSSFYLTQNDKCINNFYCGWDPGQTDNFQCDGSDGQTVLRVCSNSNFDDIQSHPFSCKAEGLNNWLPDCFTCERSPCNILLDCDPNITAGVTGYYPNCVCKNRACMISKDCDPIGTYNVGGVYPNCTCKCSNGYKGKRCQNVCKSITLPIIPYITYHSLNPNGSNFISSGNKVSSSRIYFLFALCMIALFCFLFIIVFFAINCYKRQKAKKLLTKQVKPRLYRRASSYRDDSCKVDFNDECDISSTSLTSGVGPLVNENSTVLGEKQSSHSPSRSNSFKHISTPKTPIGMVENYNWNVDAYFHDLIFTDFIRTDNEVLTSKQTNVPDVVLLKTNKIKSENSFSRKNFQ